MCARAFIKNKKAVFINEIKITMQHTSQRLKKNITKGSSVKTSYHHLKRNQARPTVSLFLRDILSDIIRSFISLNKGPHALWIF